MYLGQFESGLFTAHSILSKREQWRVQGRGPGGPAHPLIFRLNWGPRGRTKFFWRPGPPYQRVWMTAPRPLISRSGSGTAEGGIKGHFTRFQSPYSLEHLERDTCNLYKHTLISVHYKPINSNTPLHFTVMWQLAKSRQSLYPRKWRPLRVGARGRLSVQTVSLLLWRQLIW